MELRDYQSEMVKNINESWEKGNQNVMAVLPTGSGKSVIVSKIVKDTSGGVCIIAHRQELVSQMSMHLARDGIYHNIISSVPVVKMINKMHLQEYGQSFYRNQSPVAVAGVDTIIRRGESLQHWLSSVKLWVIDECFPAGTMINNKPIETIQIGDFVTAFNENTGKFSQREVKRLFKNPQPEYMVRLETESHHVVESTENHPFWTKRGWINACNLTVDDEVLIHGNQEKHRRFSLHQLWNINFKLRNQYKSTIQFFQSWSNLLPKILRNETSKKINRDDSTTEKNTNRNNLHQLWKRIFSKNRTYSKNLQSKMFQSTMFGNNGKNKPEICQRKDEEKQSNEKRIFSKKNDGNIEKNRPSTKSSRRQRSRSNRSGKRVKKVISRIWFQITNHSENRIFRSIKQFTTSLQNRLWSQGIKNCNRSKWNQSFITISKGAGQKERQGSYWTRLESIQIFKPYNIDGQTKNYVYNIEVDEEYTYTANGIVVHNCHHTIYDNEMKNPDKIKDNKWGKAVRMFPKDSKGLGVTATPLRLDGKGLGRHADGCIDDMIIGTDMRTLINRGYLTDYRIFSPPARNFNREEIKTTASGDFSDIEVNKAVKKSSLVAHDGNSIYGDVVESYIKFASGKLGVTFVPSMDVGEGLEREFNNVGVPALLVNAKTPDNERALAIKRFANGEIKQLLNVDLFGEGFDLPAISVISMVRPTKSYGLYVQMFGRALRLLKGKKHGIIIDHVGNVAGAFGHGLPDAPRTWTLDRQDKTNSGSSALNPIKTCPGCSFSYERYLKSCPNPDCDYVDEPTERTIENVDGDLEELSPETLRQLRGEISKIDRPIDDQVNEYVAGLNPHIKPLHAARHIKAFRKKVEANIESQRELRAEMAQWAGNLRADEHADHEIFKIWYTKYGIDWLASQSLESIEADKLKEWLATGKK